MSKPESSPVASALSIPWVDVKSAHVTYRKLKALADGATKELERSLEDLRLARMTALRQSGLLIRVRWILYPLLAGSKDGSLGDLRFNLTPMMDGDEAARRQLAADVGRMFGMDYQGLADLSETGEQNSLSLEKIGNDLVIHVAGKKVVDFLKSWHVRVRMDSKVMARILDEARLKVVAMESIWLQISNDQRSLFEGSELGPR